MTTTNCKYCGRLDVNDPSDYYHRHACEARHVSELLTKTNDPKAREELFKRLERARYTGD